MSATLFFFFFFLFCGFLAWRSHRRRLLVASLYWYLAQRFEERGWLDLAEVLVEAGNAISPWLDDLPDFLPVDDSDR